MEINRSTLYTNSREREAEQRLREAILQLAAMLPTLGYRMMTQRLKRLGHCVGETKVRRIMTEENLRVKTRPKPRTTLSTEKEAGYRNLVKGLSIIRPNQVWASDITYIHLRREVVYLAVVLDLFTRVIKGFKLSRSLGESLTLGALRSALESATPEIHHSDQGVQYLSSKYISMLKHRGVKISLTGRGRPWENGYVERFIRTLKQEEVYLNEYEDFDDASAKIREFIRGAYNLSRPHSRLGYLTPVEFETQYQASLISSSVG